jgi:hypothetical protein
VTRATSRTQGFQSAQEMLPILRTMLSGLAENKRAVRLLGVTVSGLISPDEIRRARQVVTPSLWWDEHREAEAKLSGARKEEAVSFRIAPWFHAWRRDQ